MGGYSGLMLWVCALGSLVLIAGYALCWLCSGNGKIAFLGAMGIWFFGTIGLVVRPHLIGLLLLSCELIILQLGRTRDTRWYFALPPLFALWINLHSSFAFGLIVLAVVLACSLPTLQAGLLITRPSPKQDTKRLAVCLALSIAALFLNPIGPKLIWYPLDVMINQPLNVASVSEWQPAPFSDGRAWALVGIAGLILLVPILRRTSLLLEELVLASLAFVLAAQHQRMLFLFGIVAMPIVCRILADTWQQNESRREHVVVNGVLLAIVAVAVISGFPKQRNLVSLVDGVMPVRALDYIRHAGLSGPMVNEYVFGGYLIWAAPERKVFIDGRADVYEAAGVLAEYGRWATVRESPNALLDRHGIRLCLMSRTHPMTRIMPLLANWKTVYSDDLSVVFARQH